MNRQIDSQAEKETSRLIAIAPNQLDHLLADGSVTVNQKVERVELSRRTTRNLLAMTGAILLVGVAWSWCAEFDVSAVAPGRLMPRKHVQIIRPAFNARITEFNVKEGDTVKAGDVLARLGAASYTADLDRLRQELSIAKTELAARRQALTVLDAFVLNPHNFPEQVPPVHDVALAMGNLYAAQHELDRERADMSTAGSAGLALTSMRGFASQQSHLLQERHLMKSSAERKKQAFVLQQQTLINQIAASEKQAQLALQTLEQQQAALKCAEDQLAAYERVYKNGGSSKVECLNAKIKVEDARAQMIAAQAKSRDLTGQVASAQHQLNEMRSKDAAAIAQLDAQVKGLSASIEGIPLKMRAQERKVAEVQTAFDVALKSAKAVSANQTLAIGAQEKKIQELNDAIAVQQDKIAQSEIKAPVDGVVARIHVVGPGQVVTAGQELLTIVPIREELCVEARVANDDAALIEPGQKALLSLPAFPQQQFGTLTGVIEQVDAFPADDKENGTSYKVTVRPSQTWIQARGRKIQLRNGLVVDSEITLRKKRLLLILLSPLLKLKYTHFRA